jgi:acyl-homoserine lactone acylase PvdQ
MSATETVSPTDTLATLILALLAPMFLWSTAGDFRLAYSAAAQTVNEYRIANRLSLFTVAKIIAFDIATLSSLSLSMYEDVSMLLALQLRSNANSMDRSGERNRRALETARQSAPAEEPVEAATARAEQMVRDAKIRIHADRPAEPAAKTAPAAATPTARTADDQRRAAWAGAMTAVAEEFTAGLKDLPAGEQWKEMARIKALTTAAGDLAPPPIPAAPAP